jgi:hypothetical protein
MAVVPAMSFAQALGASSLPKGCVADFTSLLGSGNFNMGQFVKELPPAVVKVKLQMKSPFGKPKDDDKTSVGLTVGCIKSLPESPAEIQALLKDIALKAGLNFAMDAAANLADNSIPANVAKESDSGGGALKIGVSVGLIAGSAAALIYGLIQNNKVIDFVNDENGPAAMKAEDNRNMSYGIGAALFTSGLCVIIFF